MLTNRQYAFARLDETDALITAVNNDENQSAGVRIPASCDGTWKNAVTGEPFLRKMENFCWKYLRAAVFLIEKKHKGDFSMKETAENNGKTTAKPEKRQKPAGYQPRFSELDQYLFGQATHYDILPEKMGAHLDKKTAKVGAWFTVWAPHAAGSICHRRIQRLDAHANVMRKVGEDGV